MHVGQQGGSAAFMLLPGGLGVPFGNLTSNGGLAAAFDGVYSGNYSGSTTIASSNDFQNPSHIGKLWPAPVVLGRCRAWSSNQGWAHASQPTTVQIKVQGSNDTTTGLNGTWTDLYTMEVAQTWGQQHSLDAYATLPQATAYLAHRLRLYTTNFDGVSIGQILFSVAELEFWSWGIV